MSDLPEASLRQALAELSSSSAMEEVIPPTREEVQQLFDSAIYYGPPQKRDVFYDGGWVLNHRCPRCQFQWQGECKPEARGQMTFHEWCALSPEERRRPIWEWWSAEFDAEHGEGGEGE